MKLFYIVSAIVMSLFLIPETLLAADKPEYFTVGGLHYATEKYGQEVTLIGIEDSEIETLIVPDAVTRESDGKTFVVVRIGASFENRENIFSSNASWRHLSNLKNLRTVDLSEALHLEGIGYFAERKLSGKSYYRVSYAFCDNPNLTEIIFPKNGVLKEIACSFNNIPIAALDLPEGMTTLTANSFNGCPNLKDIRFPSTMTAVKDEVIGSFKYPFADTEIDNIVILSENISFDRDIPAKKKFMPYKEYNGATNTDIQGPGLDKYYLLLDKNTAVQPVVKMFQWDFQSFAVPFADHAPNEYIINGTLHSGNDGKCSYPVTQYGDRHMNFSTPERAVPLDVNVKALNLSGSQSSYYYGLDDYSAKKRSAPLTFTCKADDSFDQSLLTVMVKETNQTLYVEDLNSANTVGRYKFTIENLKPKTQYTLGIYFGDKYLRDYTFKTKGLNPAFKKLSQDITTFTGSGTYACEGEDGDEIEEQYIIFEGIKYQGNEITLNGLAPATDYELTYHVKMKDTELETKTFKFKTGGPLEIKTVTPKVVNRSVAIVGAESNLCENETHAGLEWRKIDAPEEIPSKRSYITPIDGIMEGRIENLDPAVYYKVRAFYEKYDQSKQWYGEWIGFDPSDFSYFVPTVRTFETVVTEAEAADVKGYVLAGTDEITSQGFEYWIDAPDRTNIGRMCAPANESPSTVLANGRIMTATLTALRPDTQYVFRSFASTIKETTYGEERTFRTSEGTAAVTDIDSARPLPTVEGYFDLQGIRHDEPVRGLNIVRYSDGSVRKVIVR